MARCPGRGSGRHRLCIWVAAVQRAARDCAGEVGAGGDGAYCTTFPAAHDLGPSRSMLTANTATTVGPTAANGLATAEALYRFGGYAAVNTLG
eukprot:2075488-Prymnesium_polylepis.1